jgi:hypothetical protein
VTFLRTILLLALGAATPAYADVETSKVRAVPTGSVAIGVAGHAGKLAGLTEGAWGPMLEVALGNGRWQYLAEGSYQLVNLGASDGIAGRKLRGGLGVRWLARSFELGTRGAIDMHLEGVAGVSRTELDGMDRVVRPDLGAGVGYQIRAFYGRRQARQAGFRVSARILFAPPDRESVIAACAGSCPTPPVAGASSGFMGVFGGVF